MKNLNDMPKIVWLIQCCKEKLKKNLNRLIKIVFFFFKEKYAKTLNIAVSLRKSIWKTLTMTEIRLNIEITVVPNHKIVLMGPKCALKELKVTMCMYSSVQWCCMTVRVSCLVLLWWSWSWKESISERSEFWMSLNSSLSSWLSWKKLRA